jgi:starch synthase (maltosyl-transferring)
LANAPIRIAEKEIDTMDELRKLRSSMRAKSGSFNGSYYIPKSWNAIGYEKYHVDDARPEEIAVNPYDFFCACADALCNIGLRRRGGEKNAVSGDIIYSVLVRSFTAWAHDGRGELYSGTFLKTILLLPALKDLHVSILYLLPVFSCSDHNKKGDFGSPYAIKDIYTLDKGLHDPLSGAYSKELLELEFKALIEACHLAGIKVVVDFAFRTVARDNLLIAQHPDWFYWIKSENSAAFRPPMIGNPEKCYYICDKTVEMLYASPALPGYLSRFTQPPDRLDKEKWAALKTEKLEEIDRAIERSFGITTVPGFPDVVNDRQPAWSDVTYLKYYFDYPAQVMARIPKDQPPYIMQDGASLNHYHGSEKNEALWDYIVGVLPFYKMTYGIDGARIDMAHALPDELNAKIIKSIRAIDCGFILWSEELDPEKGGQAKDSGFDFISGFTYSDYKKVESTAFNRAIIERSFLKSAIPIAASLETPDTPRAAFIHKDPRMLRLLIAINAFMPNAVPMINSGQEFCEIQPMNLGLDNDESGKYVLPQNDPMYGKLAFFDLYCLHWQKKDESIGRTMRETFGLRRKFGALVTDKDNFVLLPSLAYSKKLTVLCYHDKKTGKGLLIAANRSEESRVMLELRKHLPVALPPYAAFNILYDQDGARNEKIETEKRIVLAPLAFQIIEFKTV